MALTKAYRRKLAAAFGKHAHANLLLSASCFTDCPAVEDGVDAVVWVHKHAAELGVDKDKIALSGFSSGANMACSVPLRLYDEVMGFPRDSSLSRPPTAKEKLERAMNGVTSRLNRKTSNSAGSAASSSTLPLGPRWWTPSCGSPTPRSPPRRGCPGPC